MTVPFWLEFPSEATVEQLTNHFILEQLGSKRAWLYSPTRNQEKQLGFDARSMNAKTLVVQYKRIIRVNSDKGVSFGINSTQHRVLKARFPKRPHPYVFFAFSTYPDYGTLDADFQTKGAPTFFGRSLFVDVWDVPGVGRSWCRSNHPLVCRSGCKISGKRVWPRNSRADWLRSLGETEGVHGGGRRKSRRRALVGGSGEG